MSDEKAAIEEVPFGRLDALGPALRALRERARLATGDLAAGCGHLGVTVSRARVEAWEASAALPTLVELVAALVVLETSPAGLFVEVMRVVWREMLVRDPAAAAALLAAQHQTPLDQLLVLHAGWLEGAAAAAGGLAPQVHARLGELRAQLRAQPGALGALLRTLPVETPTPPASGSG